MIVACVSCGASTPNKCRHCKEPLCFMCKPVEEGLDFKIHLHYHLDSVATMVMQGHLPTEAYTEHLKGLLNAKSK